MEMPQVRNERVTWSDKRPPRPTVIRIPLRIEMSKSSVSVGLGKKKIQDKKNVNVVHSQTGVFLPPPTFTLPPNEHPRVYRMAASGT